MSIFAIDNAQGIKLSSAKAYIMPQSSWGKLRKPFRGVEDMEDEVMADGSCRVVLEEQRFRY